MSDNILKLILAKDPGETRDLGSVQATDLMRLRAAWDRYAKEVGVVLSK